MESGDCRSPSASFRCLASRGCCLSRETQACHFDSRLLRFHPLRILREERALVSKERWLKGKSIQLGLNLLSSLQIVRSFHRHNWTSSHNPLPCTGQHDEADTCCAIKFASMYRALLAAAFTLGRASMITNADCAERKSECA